MMVGSTSCVADGDSDCSNGDDELGDSWDAMISAGYRWSPNVGIYLDINMGELNPQGGANAADLSLGVVTVMPTLRVFAPQEAVDLWFGLGTGPGSLVFEGDELGESVTFSRFNALDAKLEVGAAYYVNEDLAIGVSGQLLYMVNGTGELCTDSTAVGFTEECKDVDSDGEAFDLLQLGANLRYLS
jgi:hypothetical protein